MARSEEEFVKQFQYHLAGLALFGHCSESRDTTAHRAGRALDIPDEMQQLLRRMYRWVNGQPVEPAQPKGESNERPGNGQRTDGEVGRREQATRPANGEVKPAASGGAPGSQRQADNAGRATGGNGNVNGDTNGTAEVKPPHAQKPVHAATGNGGNRAGDGASRRP